MDFTLPDSLVQLRDKTRTFIREVVIPYEKDPRRTAHGPSDELRSELIAHARETGLLSPHVDTSLGGLGLPHIGRAVIFEAAGYSMLGPVALNCAAPDEGNMHLMQAVASTEQKERWLKPLAEGKTRSCFCMTEPSPGAGSDPTLLKTTAINDGDDFVINGRKWLITGADGAAFTIIMARTIVDDVDVGSLLTCPIRVFASNARWTRSIHRSPAATLKSGWRTCGCPKRTCLAKSVKGFATHRYASFRRA